MLDMHLLHIVIPSKLLLIPSLFIIFQFRSQFHRKRKRKFIVCATQTLFNKKYTSVEILLNTKPSKPHTIIKSN